MSISKLPLNHISHVAQRRLESFCAHLIANGFANGWHWDKADGQLNDLVIFNDPERQHVLTKIGRDAERDAFFATNDEGESISDGTLEHVMAEVDTYAREQRGRS